MLYWLQSMERFTGQVTYLGRRDVKFKIKTRPHKTDGDKFCFLNRNIEDWNKLLTGLFVENSLSSISFSRNIKRPSCEVIVKEESGNKQ